MILRSYMGIMISHYNDPYLPTRIHWKVRPCFFSWLNWAGMAGQTAAGRRSATPFYHAVCARTSCLTPHTHRYTSYIYMHDRSIYTSYCILRHTQNMNIQQTVQIHATNSNSPRLVKPEMQQSSRKTRHQTCRHITNNT